MQRAKHLRHLRQLAARCLFLSLWASTTAAACEHRLDQLAARGVKAGRPITAEQVERLNMVVMHEQGKAYFTPFGENHDKWIAFKSSLRSFDRFVAFDASPELAAQLGIRLDGHAIVRAKCVVGFLKSATR
jgi:hypothetical protein